MAVAVRGQQLVAVVVAVADVERRVHAERPPVIPIRNVRPLAREAEPPAVRQEMIKAERIGIAVDSSADGPRRVVGMTPGRELDAREVVRIVMQQRVIAVALDVPRRAVVCQLEKPQGWRQSKPAYDSLYVPATSPSSVRDQPVPARA